MYYRSQSCICRSRWSSLKSGVTLQNAISDNIHHINTLHVEMIMLVFCHKHCVPCDHHRQLWPSESPSSVARSPMSQPVLRSPFPLVHVHPWVGLLPPAYSGRTLSIALRGVGIKRAPWPSIWPTRRAKMSTRKATMFCKCTLELELFAKL